MGFHKDKRGIIPVTATIRAEKGLPTLYINGQWSLPNLAFLNGDTISFSQPIYDSEIAHIANAGLHVYSTITRLDFEERTNLHPRHMAVLDSILDNDPQALILLRVHVGMAQREDTPSTELFQLAGQPASQEVSVASDYWLLEAKKSLANLITQIRKHPRYAGHVFGYHLEWGEWMQPLCTVGPDVGVANCRKFRTWLCAKYPDPDDFCTAWDAEYPPEEAEVPSDLPIDVGEKVIFSGLYDTRYIDYLDYIGELVSSRIEDLAETVKKASRGENLAMAFYGYYFEIFNASSGHFHFRRLLESPWLDGFVSPATYMDRWAENNPALASSGFMTAIDSVTRAGKLWIMESDQRTYINRTDHPWDHSILPPLWNLEEIYKAHKREMGWAMLHHSAMYPMDLAGLGWYDEASIWTHFALLNDVYGAYAKAQERIATFDVALVVDESAQSQTGCSLLSAKLLAALMLEMYHTGLRFAQVEMGDLERGRADDYQMYIFANPFHITEKRADAICKTLRNGHKTALFLFGFGNTDPIIVRRLTKMDIRREKGMQDLSLQLDAEHFSRDAQAQGITTGERSVVMNEDVTRLGVYSDGAVGFAQKDNGEWNCLLFGGTGLSASILQDIATACGILVCCETPDVFSGNQQMLVLSVVTPGNKTVHFPEPVDVWDYFENTWYGYTDAVTFEHLTENCCKWLFYGKRREIEDWNLPIWQEAKATGEERGK